MIEITSAQRDALKEIGNVGMSKAAKQLSTLLNGHIEISIPEINLLGIDKIHADSLFPNDEILAYVCQDLSKDLVGKAILVFHREHTTLLTQSVIGAAPKMTEKEVRACEREAMIEIGNIIISSCMSAIVNMLSCEVKLSVPKYDEAKIGSLMETQMKDIDEKTSEIILIETALDAAGNDISGKLLLMLTKDSIDCLFMHLKKLLG